MGQSEVLEWFIARQHLDDEWYTVADIWRGLRKQKLDCTAASVRGCILKLEQFGFLEAKTNRRGWKVLPYQWRLAKKNSADMGVYKRKRTIYVPKLEK